MDKFTHISSQGAAPNHNSELYMYVSLRKGAYGGRACCPWKDSSLPQRPSSAIHNAIGFDGHCLQRFFLRRPYVMKTKLWKQMKSHVYTIICCQITPLPLNSGATTCCGGSRPMSWPPQSLVRHGKYGNHEHLLPIWGTKLGSAERCPLATTAASGNLSWGEASCHSPSGRN